MGLLDNLANSNMKLLGHMQILCQQHCGPCIRSQTGYCIQLQCLYLPLQQMSIWLSCIIWVHRCRLHTVMWTQLKSGLLRADVAAGKVLIQYCRLV